MSGTDIKALRQSGKLNEALLMALSEYQASPESIWTKNNLAWVYDAFCKKHAETADIDAFEEDFARLRDLQLLESDQRLSDSLCWRMRALLAALCDKTEEDRHPQLACRVWEMAKALRPTRPGVGYSALCKAFYRMRQGWDGFRQMIEWWGWENFRPEDYECETLPNGKKMPVSLAEGCHIFYARQLLERGVVSEMEAFLPRLETLCQQYPKMLYPGYYIGRMLVAMGQGNGSDRLSLVLPFARRKRQEYWVWKLLSEVFQDDATQHVACLLRATHCPAKELNLQRIYYLLVVCLVAHHDFVGAHHFLEKYVRLKVAEKALLPSDVQAWLHEPWAARDWKGTAPSPFLTLDFMAITDRLIGVHHTPKARVERPSGAHPTSESDSESREVRGHITANKSQTAFFLCFDKKEFAFIAPSLMASAQFVVGDRAAGTVQKKLDKKSGEMKWRCMVIKKI